MEKNVSYSVIRNTFWKFLSNLITKSGALIFVVILARFLEPEGFGLYNLAMSVVLTLTILTDAGLNNSVLRYLSYSLGKNNKKRASAYFRYFVKLKVYLTFSVSILLLLISYPLSQFVFHKPELFLPLLILSFYLIVLSLENFAEYIFYALKKVKLIFIKEIIFQISRITLAVLVFALLSGSNRLIGVLFALTLSQIIALFIFVFVISKSYSFMFKKNKLKVDKKRIFSFLKYSAIGGLSTMFFAYVDVIMLGIFLPVSYVGYYSAAVTLIGAFIALMSISNILLPVFSQLDYSKFPSSFDRVFKYICMISIPLTFGALALGKYLIRFLYGYSYLPTVLPFYFLLFLIFSNILIDVFVSMFSAIEKPEYFVKRLVFFAVLNVILNYILITSLMKISLDWAMAGAAISTLVSRSLYMVSLSMTSKKILNIKFKFSSVAKPLLSSLIMFSVILLANNFLISNMTILIGLVEIFLGTILYFLIMFLIKGISRGDFNLIKKVLLKSK